MLNLEPSWTVLGGLVAEAINESNIEVCRKAELVKIVEQMANIAHHARAHQLREQLNSGEIDSVPEWVQETIAAV